MSLGTEVRRCADAGRICCAPRTLVPIVALHCSGADGGQWRKLAAILGPGFEVHAPSFIGCGDADPWPGERAFTLMDEARAVIDIVDAAHRPVHLVGHSYGGAVAMKVACMRPDRMASLSLYEPSVFHILKQLGKRAGTALAEIEGVAAAVSSGLVTGAYHDAAATFVDYWSGLGAWTTLRPTIRDAMLRWLPKASLDFRALLDDDTPLASYRRLSCPVLVVRGERALGPSRMIAEELARQAPRGTLEVLPGAGHMGPATHATEVIGRFIAHIRSSENQRAPTPAVGSLAALGELSIS
jgi:pimeloyl-ACP methyl ester carboxylesterase